MSGPDYDEEFVERWLHPESDFPQAVSPRSRTGPVRGVPLVVAVWERASGLKADSAALLWWSMFASFKGLAIWISSAKEFQAGTNTDPVMAFSGLYCLPFHNKRLADLLIQAKEIAS